MSKKVSIIGTGFVGAASAYALAISGTCTDLLLVDLNAERAKAEATDISHAAAVSTGVRVESGAYSDIQGSDIVVVTAGVNQKPGESRLNLLARNTAILKSIMPEILKYAPDAIVLIAANPVDILTDIARELHPEHSQVIGTGTLLDTARFRHLLGVESGINPHYIHANVLGEHGDSSVLNWSAARAGGVDFKDLMLSLNKPWDESKERAVEQEVRGAAAEIIKGKHATYYGIGAAVMKIVSAILKDSRAVMTVSVKNKYGISLSLPAIMGAKGVIEVINPVLSEKEEQKLAEGAATLRETRDSLLNIL